MRRVFLTIAVVCIIALSGNLRAQAEVKNPSAVLARVNGEEILQSELDFIMDAIVVPQFQEQNPGKELSEAQKKQIEQDILNRLMMQKLILQAALEANISVDEELVNQQFEAAKVRQKDMSPEQLKQFIRNELTIRKIEQEVTSKVTVSDEEVRKVYEEQKNQFNEPEQVRASHILVKVSPEATQEEKDVARKKIEDILAQAKAGKDFADLAKEYSECPTKEKGGDLGFFARGVMVKPFEDVAFALDEGKISDVIETQFGYHIIKLTEKKSQRTIPFEKAKDDLKKGILQQKVNLEFNNWINNLRANAKIEIMAPKPGESSWEMKN